MYDYQKENNVKKCCIQNVQFLYDTIKINFPYADVEPKAVIVVVLDSDDGKTIKTYNHMILYDKILNKVLEPSYEVGHLEYSNYFDTFNTLIESMKNKNYLIPTDDVKFILEHHMNFCKFANQMKKGKLCITDKKIYNEQADYVEKKI